ncbi:MAG: hypothetical protein A2045_05380 [Rhodocyclales bacterium GWA2_65_20]|nr:MAG: hypothetical protein A2045_05380 [Rhodocyclales bacterium GWA2_65_20]
MVSTLPAMPLGQPLQDGAIRPAVAGAGIGQGLQGIAHVAQCPDAFVQLGYMAFGQPFDIAAGTAGVLPQ